ncbi:hypothetical protein L1987_10474 [Smallanthus sonchifolius]|uniref:Uncharacterized protein n=1 Tax=Smallanthus sonchifolius TaxID=185202 RepID=A0ACB9JSB6_9ASTR|nr:hypothetical protein L1987_10474 [Smallanthus sonchifolius]
MIYFILSWLCNVIYKSLLHCMRGTHKRKNVGTRDFWISCTCAYDLKKSVFNRQIGLICRTHLYNSQGMRYCNQQVLMGIPLCVCEARDPEGSK